VNADAQDVTVNVGDSVQIEYYITGAGGDDQKGCNFGPNAEPSGGSATISLGFDSNKLQGPKSVEVNDCGPQSGKTVTFKALEAGSVRINVLGARDTNAGTWTYTVAGDANVGVTVAAPPPATNTPPEITVPSDFTVTGTSDSGASVPFKVTASDAEDGDLTNNVVCKVGDNVVKSGDTFPLGKTIVTCSATDAAGNTVTDTFTVTVHDTKTPVLTLASNPTEEATGPNGAVVTYTATATDLVDGTVTVICTPASGSTFALGPTTVTCNAQDKA